MLILLRIIMWPFSQLLNILFTLTGSYGLAIILFAVIIKLVMLYPSAKSKRNAMHMSRMNPKLQEIKKRCGKDQQKYAMEVQKLYQEEHVNPMGGCLWSFLPLPILIALYGIIRRPVINFMLINMPRGKALEQLEVIRETLTGAGFQITGQQAYEEISIARGITEHLDLIQPIVPQVFPIDFHFLGLDLTAIPWNSFMNLTSGEFSWSVLGLVMIPIVSGVLNLLLSVLSMRTSVPADDAMKSQQTMMTVMMPLMSVYIGFILPASLGVYWISMSVFSIIQELILQKYYGAKLDREEAEREEAARQDRLRRMEEAKNRPHVQSSNTSREKQKRLAQQGNPQKKKKNSTTEAGRIGDRPYARGRSFGSHYDELDDETPAPAEEEK